MNPFEIRLELLKLAQSIEFEKMMAERIRLESDWQSFKSTYPFPSLPAVQVEDVIKTAESLNTFVSKKD